jgi:hypothetical protein
MIHYSYDFIINLANNFSATLDEDVANRLLEIKKGNKFIRRKSPMRMKYKIHESVAQNWRKEREDNKQMTLDEKFNLEMYSNLNKLTTKNYTAIVEKILLLCNELLNDDNKNEYEIKIVKMVFDKALTEKTFSYLYAQLLSNLYENNFNDIVKICNELSDEYFKNSVEMKIEEVNTDMSDDELRNVFSNKNQLAGGYIFMANLFVFNLLSYESILKYYNGILKYFNMSPVEYCDIYLDIIESLLKTAGYQLEQKAPSKDDFYDDFMNELYDLQGQKLDNNPRMSNKNRFKLMDITDLYKRNWNVRELVDDDTDNTFKKNKDKRRK